MSISDALKINGILPPLQFPPPGIKRDFRGIHRQSVPTEEPEQEQERLCPAISRQGAGRSTQLGAARPEPEAGQALHPAQVKHAKSGYAVNRSGYAAKRPAGRESSTGGKEVVRDSVPAASPQGASTGLPGRWVIRGRGAGDDLRQSEAPVVPVRRRKSTARLNRENAAFLVDCE